MNTFIHRVKEVTRSKIKKMVRDKEQTEATYTMDITITFFELGDCRGSKGKYYDNSDKTLFGEVEVETRLTLFAETREALKLKAEALS